MRRRGAQGAAGPSLLRRRAAALFFPLVAFLCAAPLSAQAQPADPGDPPVQTAKPSDVDAGAAPDPAEERTPLGTRVLHSLRDEVRRYVDDSVVFFQRPLHWSKKDWEKAGGVAVVVGGLMFADEEIDRQAQKQRSRFTDRVSSATTALGGAWGFHLAGGLLGAGILINHENMRDTGREALEAGFLATILDKYIIKRAFGRERPYESNGETVFVPGSAHDSFPSGHATEAFAVASVIAARSKGWIIPTIAYGTAAIVCMDRVNNHVHFASDVVAGAILGTVTGRFLVHKHFDEKKGVLSKPEKATELDVVPIRNGLAISTRF